MDADVRTSMVGPQRPHAFQLVTVLALVLSLSIATNAHSQVQEVPSDIARIEAPFPMPQLDRPSIPDRDFDIREFGATAGASDVTEAIHRAIEAANASGGGRVIVPQGTWHARPIHLMSNVNLHVSEGALVRFSTNREDYLPVVRQRHEGVEAYNYSPMIYAYGLQNVAVTGKGTLDAQGEHWWTWFEQYGPPPRAIATQVPLSRRDFGKGSGMEGMRPNFVVFLDCENVLVEGITLNDSPMWNVHLIYTDGAIVRDITVNSLDAPNGDGIVIDSSTDVLVEYNRLRTGDDAVVLKSGLNEEGLLIDRPTENVVIRHFEATDVRTGSGGVVFGSETSGGIRNVYVHDAYFEGSDRGIRFKTERGRGNVIENIFVRDVRMKNITYEAINVNSFYTGPDVVGVAPAIRNIHISDVDIDGVPTAISLIGLPEKWIEDFTLENIRVRNADAGARITRVKNIALKNVSISSRERALIADDTYQMTFENVALDDRADGHPVLLRGRYTGAIRLNDFPAERISFEDGLTSDVIVTGEIRQAW
jgi:polygalacturonase